MVLVMVIDHMKIKRPPRLLAEMALILRTENARKKYVTVCALM